MCLLIDLRLLKHFGLLTCWLIGSHWLTLIQMHLCLLIDLRLLKHFGLLTCLLIGSHWSMLTG